MSSLCRTLFFCLLVLLPTAESAFKNAWAEAEKLVRAQPGNATPLTVLALIDAKLGEKQKAIHEARTAWRQK